MSERRLRRRLLAAAGLAVLASWLGLPIVVALDDGSAPRCCRSGCCSSEPAEGVCLRAACGCGEGGEAPLLPLVRTLAVLSDPFMLPVPPALGPIGPGGSRCPVSPFLSLADPPPRFAPSAPIATS